jgi:PKD repeat protein
VKVDLGAAPFTPGAPPGGDCTAAGQALYQSCNLTYELDDQSLSQDGFVDACNAGELPQCVHSCAEQHSQCNLLAGCVGFCTDQWCSMDFSYLYDTCGLAVELEAGSPLPKDEAIALCDEVGYSSVAMKCVLECIARGSTCGDVSTCMNDCVMCPFPTVDFTADVTAGDAPLTVTFTRNVVIPPNCPPTVTHWDFGDGATTYDDADVVEHTYTAGGTYSVELRVTNGAGPGIKFVPDMITVNPLIDDDTVDDDTTDDDAVDDDAVDDDVVDDDAVDDDALDDDTTDDDAVDDDAVDDDADDDSSADDDQAGGDDDATGGDDDDSGGCGC